MTDKVEVKRNRASFSWDGLKLSISGHSYLGDWSFDFGAMFEGMTEAQLYVIKYGFKQSILDCIASLGKDAKVPDCQAHATERAQDIVAGTVGTREESAASKAKKTVSAIEAEYDRLRNLEKPTTAEKENLAFLKNLLKK